jgi:hypothetical protein
MRCTSYFDITRIACYSDFIHKQLQKGLVMFLLGILFLGLWIAGEATANTLGGFIHVLLVLSLMVILSQLIRSQRGSRLAELSSAPETIDTHR